MFLMYVDESGDVGMRNSPTRYFILSAIVVHELRWRDMLDNLVDFRRMLRDRKGLKLREEIHSTDFINKPGELKRIKRNDRVDILKKCMDWLNAQSYANTYSVVVDKHQRQPSDDIFELAWNTLLMRFENTIRHRNFGGPQNADERGVVIADNTEGGKLRKLVRRMRHFNYIPNRRDLSPEGSRNIKLEYLIEDPVFRDSRQSLLHQIVDVVAYCTRQRFEPNNYMKKKGGHRFYFRLSDVVVKEVTRKNDLGLVLI